MSLFLRFFSFGILAYLFVSFDVADASATNLNNMRASAGFYLSANGDMCMIDVRGRFQMTPSFLKPSGSRSKKVSDLPVCSVKEKKAFQKKIKGLYLKNDRSGRVYQTALPAFMMGAMSVMKHLGAGCIAGSLYRLAIEFTVMNKIKKGISSLSSSDKQLEAQTEAGSFCHECLRDLKNTPSNKIDRAEQKVRDNLKQELETALIEHEKKTIMREFNSPKGVSKRVQKIETQIASLKKEQASDMQNYKQVSAKLKEHINTGLIRWDAQKKEYLLTADNASTGGLIAGALTGSVVLGGGAGMAVNSAQTAIDHYNESKLKLEETAKKIAQKVELKKTFTKSMTHVKNLKIVQKIAHLEAVQKVTSQRLTTVDILKRLPVATIKLILKPFSFLAKQIFSKAGMAQMGGAMICDGGIMFLLNKESQPETEI